MGPEQLAETGRQTFIGVHLYDQMVPVQHFLRQLKGIIDWKRFACRLIKLYKGEGVVGRPPFDLALVLKMERIAYLYHLSERQVEE